MYIPTESLSVERELIYPKSSGTRTVVSLVVSFVTHTSEMYEIGFGIVWDYDM